MSSDTHSTDLLQLPFTSHFSTLRVALCLMLATNPCFSESPPVELLQEDFDRLELGSAWTVQSGEWTIKDGVLHATHVKADNHPAAARCTLETRDATYLVRFNLGANTKAFHFGFDPSREESNKKGHLFSAVISPTEWRIMKHPDKKRPKEDPGEKLAEEARPFVPGTWYTLKLTTEGNRIVASIDGAAPLVAEHASFSVKKPALVFRVSGGEARIDDILVTTH